jgi:hypothetical protein
MKKVFYLLLATLMVASCTKEDIIPGPTGQGRLNITLASAMPSTRATGKDLPTAAAEKAIQHVTVGIFKADKSINKIFPEITINESKTNSLVCSAGNGQTVVVVANAPTGTFSKVTDKDSFLSVALSLEQTINDAAGDPQASQTSDWLPMVGMDESVDIAEPATPSDVTEVTISISRLVARIALKNVYIDLEDPTYTFQMSSVQIVNASTETIINPSSSLPATTEIKNVKDYAWLKSTAAGGSFSGDNGGLTILTQPVWFYVFANDNSMVDAAGAALDTRLVIEGKLNGETNFYPVYVNKEAVGTTFTGGGTDTTVKTGKIYRNYSYSINATIKAKGTQKPDDPFIAANMQVTITPEPWVLDLTQDVTFE